MMYDQVKYDKGTQLLKMSNDSISNNDKSEELSEPLEILCCHDGVLLKKASAEFMSDLETSGSINLIKYLPSNRYSIEWRPNDKILITHDDGQDQGEWSLVDTISRRQRTISECKVFNTKCEPLKPQCVRIDLDEIKSIELISKGQAIRFLKKSDNFIHSEYFFQHGTADSFIRSLQHYHILDVSQNNRREYEVLNAEAQKLRTTFAELNLDDIKSSSISTNRWLPNRVVDFLVKFPDYVAPVHVPKHSRPSTIRDEYEVLEDDKIDTETEKQESEPDIEVHRNESVVLPNRKINQRGRPLTENQWKEFRTEDGRISDPTRIKEVIFRGGIEDQLRCEVWKYLLGYFNWADTTDQRAEHRCRKSTEYYQMKAQWLSMSITQENNFTGYRDRKCQIEKDVKRTDRSLEFFNGDDNPNLVILQDILMTYVMYNFDLGYVQGMSDLLAPILMIQKNEVDSFWCFVGFMDLVFSNFDIDQAGMKQQLAQLTVLLNFSNRKLYEYLRDHGSDNMYFCFRWLLVWYKREFSNDDILELWESLWTRLPCINFHLLIAVAILDQQSEIIIGNELEFTQILKHINELSLQIDVKYILELAEAIYEQIKNSDSLTNEIRLILGEELVEPFEKDTDEPYFDDSFDELVREPTQEEIRIQQKKLDEACEQSMFLSFI